MGAPRVDSRLLDLEAIGGPRPRVYVVDEGRVFVRVKEADDAYSAYSPWHGLAPNGATLLAAARLSDGSQHVATSDRDRQVFVSAETSTPLKFSQWTQVAQLPEQALELVMVEGAASRRLLALDADGNVWQNAEDAEWTPIATPPSPFTGIAARVYESREVVLGITAVGIAYQLINDQWRKLEM